MDKVLDFFRRGFGSLVTNGLVAAVVAAGVSFPVSYYAAYRAQVNADIVAQKNENLAARANEFSASIDAILPVVGQYLRAVNQQQDVNEAQQALRLKLAEELAKSNLLETTFGPDIRPAVVHYQGAIELLIGSISDATDPTKMYSWTVYMDQVLQAKSQLSDVLMSHAGIA